MHSRRTSLIEQLENRLMLAANLVAAGTLFTTDDGARAIRINWRGHEENAIANSWILQLSGYSGNLLKQQSLASPRVKLAGNAFQLERHMGTNGLFKVYAPTSITVDETLRRFSKIPGFQFAEPDFLYSIDLTPNDPSFGTMWGLNNTGQSGGTVDADIDAPEAWNTTTGSTSVVVGMVDTGIDYNHPDLSANIWANPFEIPGNGIDDEGNGYVDDIRGYDWWGNASSQGTPDADPMDQNDHGTHTAGTVGAKGNNSVGVTGVNWNVKMIPLKIGGPGSAVSSSAAISALYYCLDMKNRGQNIVVTNHSWGGGGFSSALNTAIADQASGGILLAAAAGNGGADLVGDNNDVFPFYPASYTQPNVISVGNMTRNNTRAGSSNFGATSVDLFAPGTSILSTIRVADGSYASFDGTSMATPHVAGVAALLAAANPGANMTQIRDAILQTTEPVAAFNGICVTGGRLSADDAINQVMAFPTTPGMPDMTAGSDSGISNSDNNTNDNTPTFSGSGTNGNTIKIYSDGNEVGNAVVAGGTYNITVSALSDGPHQITATATNAAGTSPPSVALPIVIDTVSPQLLGVPVFNYMTAPHALIYSFSESVSATWDSGDVTVTKLPSTPIGKTASFNAGNNQGSMTFAGVLADGDYNSILNTSGVSDVAGNPLALAFGPETDVNFPFFFLMCDANHDRQVNLNDFNIFANNFGLTPRDFTQGDFNYDTNINLSDFNLLASRFGASLSPQESSRATGLAPRTGKSPFSQTTTADDLLDLLNKATGGAALASA